MKRNAAKAAALVGLLLGAVAVKVWADGIPTTTPLAYSGVLQDSVGNAITTAQSIQITLWDDATANASANQKCTTPTQSVTPDSQGRFRVVLDQQCYDVVRINPNLWVQLQVGSTVLPRSKIGAVPYAVEAGKAQRVVYSAGMSTRTTIDGLYCGATPLQTGAWSAMAGALTGYRAGKRLCEQACTSPTAHACSGLELARFVGLGGTSVPDGWVVNGTYGQYSGGNGGSSDCQGFTVGTTAAVGNGWVNGTSPYAYSCDSQRQILCCD